MSPILSEEGGRKVGAGCRAHISCMYIAPDPLESAITFLRIGGDFLFRPLVGGSSDLQPRDWCSARSLNQAAHSSNAVLLLLEPVLCLLLGLPREVPIPRLDELNVLGNFLPEDKDACKDKVLRKLVSEVLWTEVDGAGGRGVW